MHDPKVSALLRLKRFEQPPAGYFDDLLKDVHRRQREELLHRPLWKIAFERTQVFFGEHSMGNLSYAGAMASVLVVGVVAIRVMTPGASQPSDKALVAESAAKPSVSTVPVSAGANRMLVLGPQNGTQFAPLMETRRVSSTDPRGQQIAAPRYVIDARPVSYERASSF